MYVRGLFLIRKYQQRKMYSERLRTLCRGIKLPDAELQDIMLAPTPFTVRHPKPATATTPGGFTYNANPSQNRGTESGGLKVGTTTPLGTTRNNRIMNQQPTSSALRTPRVPATARTSHQANTSRKTNILSGLAIPLQQSKAGQVGIAPYYKKGSAEARDAGSKAVWVYGCVEVKKTDSFEFSFNACRKIIDRLVTAAQKDQSSAHLVFDIVATKTNIANGAPRLLGQALYDYVNDMYAEIVATCFVGLTDTTSRRVGRDMYCPCEEFSRKKLPFTDIDNNHMFIVEPKGLE